MVRAVAGDSDATTWQVRLRLRRKAATTSRGSRKQRRLKDRAAARLVAARVEEGLRLQLARTLVMAAIVGASDQWLCMGGAAVEGYRRQGRGGGYGKEVATVGCSGCSG
ncbi:hypothetical protein B296_00058022 [Ensete ventricosum]|uniref:Uncharacterized protein n=1 Tax=Ensete ventricosum TaxID=4639 RepID=A0A426X6L6_ENSVE|nr:hypothetical protein B296_00058022 [Ensete ventricosum]